MLSLNKLNFGLTILLLVLVIYGFWPNFLFDLINVLKAEGFIIQVLAVGLGVFGGMWADKRLQKQATIRETVGSLEVIDAELQSNIKATGLIKNAINDRPSFNNRSKLTLDKVLELARDEERWIGKFSKQLVDNGYYTVLSTISRLENRKLFEKLVNSYLDLRNTQLVLGLEIMDDNRGDYSDEQKIDFIKIGDQNFGRLTEHLSVLEEKLKSVDKEVVDEEKKLLLRIKRF